MFNKIKLSPTKLFGAGIVLVVILSFVFNPQTKKTTAQEKNPETPPTSHEKLAPLQSQTADIFSLKEKLETAQSAIRTLEAQALDTRLLETELKETQTKLSEAQNMIEALENEAPDAKPLKTELKKAQAELNEAQDIIKKMENEAHSAAQTIKKHEDEEKEIAEIVKSYEKSLVDVMADFKALEEITEAVKKQNIELMKIQEGQDIPLQYVRLCSEKHKAVNVAFAYYALNADTHGFVSKRLVQGRAKHMPNL